MFRGRENLTCKSSLSNLKSSLDPLAAKAPHKSTSRAALNRRLKIILEAVFVLIKIQQTIVGVEWRLMVNRWKLSSFFSFSFNGSVKELKLIDVEHGETQLIKVNERLELKHPHS